jgi:hypothetical protein
VRSPRAHLVDVRSGLEEGTHRVDVPLTRGKQQRREATHVPDQLRVHEVAIDAGCLRFAVLRRLRRPTLRILFGERVQIHDLRGGSHVRAAPCQQPDRRHAVVGRGKHQGRLAASRLLRVDVGAGIQQRADGVDIAGCRGEHQR